MRRVTALLIVAVCTVYAQSAELGALTASGYSNSVLGFRYTPPSSLVLDQTSQARDNLQKRAAELHPTSSSSILLRLISGGADTAPDWASLAVMTYNRASWSDVDDFHAETRMNATMAGGALPIGDKPSITFSGVMFAASQFEIRQGALTKHATVYSTVRRGKLLAFAFSGNSAEIVAKDADSLKSLSFFDAP